MFADVLDPASLPAAMAGGDIAYYLVHSMGLADGFEEQDRAAARNFGAAARAAGVRRIIYLGGLGEAESCDLAASAQPAGGRRPAARVGRRGDRVPGVGRPRVGQSVV